MLNQFQLNRLKQLVESYHVLFAVKVLGEDILTEEDKDLLREFGFEPEGKEDYWEFAYKFGKLSALLKDANKIVPSKATKMLADVHLTKRDRIELDVLKGRSFSHIKKLGNNVASAVFDEVSKREAYEDLLREELGKVVRGDQAYSKAISNIGNKTGDWERDLNRLVETELHDVQQEGQGKGLWYGGVSV